VRTPAWDQAIHLMLLLLFMAAGAVALISGLAPLMFPDSPRGRLANPRLAIALLGLAIVGFIGERLYHTL
jgi:hypothetical protein